MIIACMLMTFMPVLAEETVVNNYLSTDFGADVALKATATNVSGQLTLKIAIAENYPALYGYVWEKGEYTLDETKKGLYHTADNTYVTGKLDNSFQGATGNMNFHQVKSPFIEDFVFEGTYDGVTYTMPIKSYGLTNSHDDFQFIVDTKAYPELSDDAATGQWSIAATEELTQSQRRALWSDVKIVNKATGKEFAARENFGMYSPFRIDFCSAEAIAKALPEYFYAGPKVIAEGTRSAYAKGYNGPLPTSDVYATNATTLGTKASFKVDFDGKEIELPINIRVSGSTTIYAVLKVEEFNAAAGTNFVNSSNSTVANRLQSDENVAKISNIRLTAKKTYIGEFPTNTAFVSGMKVLAENGYTGQFTDTSSSVKYIKANEVPLNYIFTVPEAGEYDVYCLTWDSNDSTQRAGKVYVNNVLCDYTKCTLGTSTMQSYWEPAGTVTLSSDINILTVPKWVGNDGNSRFGGIAFVPTSENFEMDATVSAKLAAATTGVVDIYNEGTILATASDLTISSPDYDPQVLTVTVDGTEYEVEAGAGALNTDNYYDAQGNFITGATVTDAIAMAGISKRNADGKVNAILADGRNVNPDRTLLYDGMVITVVDGANVTKANFAPVLRDDIDTAIGETTAPAGGVGINTLGDFRVTTTSPYYYAKLFPFMAKNTEIITEAADNNLIGCKVGGYLTVTGAATASDIVNHAGVVAAGIKSLRAGTKIYFLEDPIVKVAANLDNIFTGPDENGQSTPAQAGNFNQLVAPSPEDATVGVFLPYKMANQKANSGYYNTSEWFITNTSATDTVYANKIKDGKWQLLTTGTAPCQIMIVDANSGAVKSILKDQVVTGIAPLTVTLEAGEKAYVWGNNPFNGTVTTAGTSMKPLCNVLTY